MCSIAGTYASRNAERDTTMRAQRAAGLWRDFLPLSAVIVCGILLAVAAFVSLRGYYITSERQQFRRTTTSLVIRFEGDVARHLSSLSAIDAFVTTSHVSRWDFSTYAHQILPQNKGLRAVLWVPTISSRQRSAYEAGLQQDGLYGLRIHGLGQPNTNADRQAGKSYMPVTYVDPSEGNIDLIGLDLASIPSYAQLFRDASQIGNVAASAPIDKTLVTGSRGPAVLLALPLKGSSGAGLGYVLGILEPSTVLADAMGSSGVSIEAAFAYGNGNQIWGAQGWQESARWFGEAPFHQIVPVVIGSRRFSLAIRSTSQPDPINSTYIPFGAAVFVLALTLLLAQNMFTIVFRKRAVERAVVMRTAELRTANQALVTEIEQRRLAEASLRVARDNAERASRAKSSFMAAMSHELRTPLNVIIGFSGLMVETNKPAAQHADYASQILVSGRKLLELINDILDLTEMESGETAVSKCLVYLSDCTRSLVDDVEAVAGVAGLTLKIDLPEDLPPILGDHKRIRRAIAHLISNAIKFTPRGGSVIVAVRNSDGALVVEVSDTGIGIPATARKRIREDFWQNDGKLGRRYEGTGLGLAYVARVARLHGARFDMYSEPGNGTCVRLTFKVPQSEGLLEVA
jgi:signal transduction histidine kinase